MSGPLFLAFGHSSRVGKDTAARAAVAALEAASVSVELRSFAGPLKKVCYKLFGEHGLRTGPYYEMKPEERSISLPGVGLTPVQIWVRVGNALRGVYAGIWAEQGLRPSSLSTGYVPDVVVLSDLRFPSELAGVLDRGGEAWKVLRPGCDVVNGSDRMIPQECAYWSGALVNDGTVAELESRAAGLALAAWERWRAK